MAKLLFLCDRFPPNVGGLATSAGRICRGLVKMGLNVDVLVWSRQLPAGTIEQQDAMSDGLQIYHLGRYRHWDMTLPHTLNFLEGRHQTSPYAGIWGHYLFPGGFVATWFGTLHGIPSWVSVRGNDLDRDLYLQGDFARLNWTLERATHVTTVTQDLAHKVRSLTQRQTVHVLPNGVDTEVFAPAETSQYPGLMSLRAALGILDKEVVLGFSGELRQKKGQGFLLSALTRVRRQQPACLLIIGEVRMESDSLLDQYRLHYPDDGERVIITGHLTDPNWIAQHLRLCDLYLQPSLWEGMPNALLEAMACGCACLASDAGGIPEVIRHGETGFILPRMQLGSLGDGVLEWLTLDPTTQQEIRHNARRYIVKNHSLAEEGRHLKTLLDSLEQEKN